MKTSIPWFTHVKRLLTLVSALVCASLSLKAETLTWTLMNPTGHSYRNELVRVKVDVPKDISQASHALYQNGEEIPWQLEEIDGRMHLWAKATLEKDQIYSYELKEQATQVKAQAVRVSSDGDHWLLDNGKVALKLPKQNASGEIPSPITQIQLPGTDQWVGQGHWNVSRKLTGFSSELIGDGTVFAKVRLRYEFEGMAGLNQDISAFAQIDITLPPDRTHAIIEEIHEMPRHTYWEFDCASGWDARQSITRPHAGGFGRPDLNDSSGNPYPWPPESLHVGQTRMGDTLLNLWPRWSQAYDDGWFYLVHNGTYGIGAMVVRAGKWEWPHSNGISIKVKESADYAGLRCPTWKGKRYWYLVVGHPDQWKEKADQQRYAVRHAYEALDKLHQEYILDWPGLEAPAGTPAEEAVNWGSGAGRFAIRSNPMPGWQNANPGYKRNKHPIFELTRAQVELDPDTYGTYWQYWSPENPNFASKWNIDGIEAVLKMSGKQEYWGKRKAPPQHPRYADLVKLAQQKIREDMHHSITLPSGAGQECPGYQGTALNIWAGLRPTFQALGFDPLEEWPYAKKGAEFLVKASYPVGDGTRRSHPAGDTHPPGPNITELVEQYELDVVFEGRKTEELEGFGTIFRSRSGAPSESYFAFKAGPNRGHYHGDQLSFHYAPYGMLQLPDHHCSYGPRAGQEHMHNRVAFHTEEMPYGNMDGYERTIGWKVSDHVDVAIAQVESERLRFTTPFPPEGWDISLPQVPFSDPLKYRRTVVFIRNGEKDYVVLRDQHIGPDVSATYCLHAYGDTAEQDGNRFNFDGLHLAVVAPEKFETFRHDWEHSNGGLEATKGIRLTTRGTSSEFITVLVPKPREEVPLTKLTLNKALKLNKRIKKNGERVRVSVETDITLLIPWAGAELDVDNLYIMTPSFTRTGLADGSIKIQSLTPKKLTFDLTLSIPRKKKDPEIINFTVEVERDGNSYQGSFSGEFRGSQTSGDTVGTWQERAMAPALLHAPFTPPEIEAIPNGVRVGTDEIVFDGVIDEDASINYVLVKRDGSELIRLSGSELNLDRKQGEIGLFVPNAGYPFGVVPDWLIKQRIQKPDWYEAVWPLARTP